MLFFYPADFTFICPTEVTGFSKMAQAFAAENAIILGASVIPSTAIARGRKTRRFGISLAERRKQNPERDLRRARR